MLAPFNIAASERSIISTSARICTSRSCSLSSIIKECPRLSIRQGPYLLISTLGGVILRGGAVDARQNGGNVAIAREEKMKRLCLHANAGGLHEIIIM